MSSVFTVTREDAAMELNVSTRTIDRYIRAGKISYKKIANKILLNTKDVAELKGDFDTPYQKIPQSELISSKSTVSSNKEGIIDSSSLEKVIDEKIDKFFLIFQEKDRMLEEKNKVIFMLQQRVGELENKIHSMVALPDYNQEKQLATIEKTKLEEKIKDLNRVVVAEKNKGYLFLLMFFIVAISFIVGYILLRKGMIALV